MKSSEIIKALDYYYPEAKCELEYQKDYELLIATVLSAQCTDKRVNMVTKILWQKYDLKSLAQAQLKDIEQIIRPCGTYTRKAVYIKQIAINLLKDYEGQVPNNRQYLEQLPGVGRKTCNVVLSNIYNVPAIAVDTHVARVSKRLGIAKANDDIYTIEKKLMRTFPKEKWSKIHHQLVLFGRYQCLARNPQCVNCLLQNNCLYYRINNQKRLNKYV